MGLVKIDVSEEDIVSIIRMKRSSSRIPLNLMLKVIISSEMSVLTRAAHSHIPDGAVLHMRMFENRVLRRMFGPETISQEKLEKTA
jgi:hypothetical protein